MCENHTQQLGRDSTPASLMYPANSSTRASVTISGSRKLPLTSSGVFQVLRRGLWLSFQPSTVFLSVFLTVFDLTRIHFTRVNMWRDHLTLLTP